MSKIDAALFDQHFRENFSSLSNYAFAFVKDKELSKEIVQDVFVGVWEKRDQLRITSSFRSYLYQTVKNRSLNHLRDSKKLRFVSEVPDQSEENLERAELPVIEELKMFMDRLPERCREIFMMKRVEGRSYKEISVEMNISEKTVENQMTIAFKKLREFHQNHRSLLGETE